jgi:nitrate/nitrite transport system substrate-binding protein
MLTQMQRWGYVKGDVNYNRIAEQVFLATDARKRMAEMGYSAPKANYSKHSILGKTFDPAKAKAYLKSLPMSKA